MPTERPKPVCFVAMPFGKKAPPGRKKPKVDFDAIYAVIERAIVDCGLECVRADVEPGGGFIHKAMYERLLLAEYVVADISFGNPNVAYELGVRHGGSPRSSLIICADGPWAGPPAFDFAPLRLAMYKLKKDGSFSKASAKQLAQAIEKYIELSRAGQWRVDNPLLQLTSVGPGARVEHEKTDAFLNRVEFAGQKGEEVAAAIRERDPEQATRRLAAIEGEVLAGPDTVEQLYTVLMSLFLGYREKEAYEEMISLAERMPPDLAQSTVVHEQVALALNRLAEQRAKAEDYAGADAYRAEATARLGKIPDAEITSETRGIEGRIYKGWYEAEGKAGHGERAAAMLDRAIESYLSGLRADPRDYYPGVNAVTLLLLRNDSSKNDLEALRGSVPVVRFAVERAPEAKGDEERYWQLATKLELAGADRDWDSADAFCRELLPIPAHDWMRKTTVKNLGIQRTAFRDDPEAVRRLDALVELLKPAPE